MSHSPQNLVRRTSLAALTLTMLLGFGIANCGAQETRKDTRTADARQFFVDVKPGLLAPSFLAAPVAQAQGTTGRVTNVFAEEDVRQALRDIGAQAGVVIVPDATVQGTVSIELRDVPVEKALELVLFSGGFVYKKVNGAYLVGTPDPQNPTFTTLADVKRVTLHNLKAAEVVDTFSAAYKKFVQADAANNVLVITAPQSILETIAENVALLDQPLPQVMIEVLVAEISTGAAKRLGVTWRWDSFGFNVGNPLDDTRTTGGATSTSGNSNSMSWTEATTLDLANLRLLVDKNSAVIRANPRVSTLDGREAEIFVGREQYFSVYTGNTLYPTTQLQLVKAGITLKIKPNVGEDGNLLIAIDPEVSDVVSVSENGAPVIATRKVHTTVRCKESGTIVLGGLTQVIKSIQETKVPVLGDLPLIGSLFRDKTRSSEETEVVIFLRPHILRNGAAATWQPSDEWPEIRGFSGRQEDRMRQSAQGYYGQSVVAAPAPIMAAPAPASSQYTPRPVVAAPAAKPDSGTRVRALRDAYQLD